MDSLLYVMQKFMKKKKTTPLNPRNPGVYDHIPVEHFGYYQFYNIVNNMCWNSLHLNFDKHL